MFRVTQVEWQCSSHDTLHDSQEPRITVHQADTAPMPELPHPIDRWWVRSGRTYRTPLMTGTALS